VLDERGNHSVVKCNELDIRMQGPVTSFCKYQSPFVFFLKFYLCYYFFLFFNGEVLLSEIYNVVQKTLKKILSYVKVFVEDAYHLYHIRQEPSMTKAN